MNEFHDGNDKCTFCKTEALPEGWGVAELGEASRMAVFSAIQPQPAAVACRSLNMFMGWLSGGRQAGCTVDDHATPSPDSRNRARSWLNDLRVQLNPGWRIIETMPCSKGAGTSLFRVRSCSPTVTRIDSALSSWLPLENTKNKLLI